MSGFRILLLLVLYVLPVAGQTAPCDTSALSRTVSGESGYKRRSADRCEGFFGQKVSRTTAFFLTSLVQINRLQGSPTSPITLTWPAHGTGRSIHLRGELIRHNFQMDAIARPDSLRFFWVSEVLFDERIPIADMGLLGWTDMPIEGALRRVYLPLTAYQDSPIKPCGPYSASFWTDLALSNPTVTIVAVANRTIVWDAQRFGRRTRYTGGNLIHVPLPNLPEPGVYRVTVAAQSSEASLAPVVFLLFHSGATSSCGN